MRADFRGDLVRVTLVRYTPDPELTIAAAARISASPSPVTEHLEKLTPQKADRLLAQLISAGHLSPLEHASFTFSIEGISRVTSHQLVRHRLASYTQQSQRFVSLKNLGYVTPPSIKQRPELLALYQQGIRAAFELYLKLQEAGVPAEDARYLLPSALETHIVMTMNARELITAAGVRLCLKAQWEIIQLFEALKAEVRKVAPRIGEELRPKCYKMGYCDEPHSCGLFPTLNETAKPAKQK